MTYKKLSIVFFALILSVSLSRIIPHPPNFTPIISLAIIGPFLFRNLYLCIFCILCSMIISDFFIGFHDGLLQIYLIITLICILFDKFKKKVNSINLLYLSFSGSLIFFMLSNFNVWFFGDLYAKDINGLINCYIMAIPFFTNTLISTIIFSYLIFFISNEIAKISYLKN